MQLLIDQDNIGDGSCTVSLPEGFLNALQAVFREVTKRLGIKKSPVTIHLHTCKYMDLALRGDTQGAIHNGELRMRINGRISRARMVATLCHELVHVRQMVQGDLIQNSKGELYWKGDLQDPIEYRRFMLAFNHDYYLRQTWEVEARAKALELLPFVKGIVRDNVNKRARYEQQGQTAFPVSREVGSSPATT